MIQFPDYANGFPTYVNYFPTYEIGYPITEIEFPFDEITFPTNGTDLKNMNFEITIMQMNFKEIKFNYIISYSFHYNGVYTAFCIVITLRGLKDVKTSIYFWNFISLVIFQAF